MAKNRSYSSSNNLSHVVPPKDAMSQDERFIGPIFDESGVRFLLVYNQKLKAFHYLLDETITPNETFNTSKTTDRILIGKRTGSRSIATTSSTGRFSSASMKAMCA